MKLVTNNFRLNSAQEFITSFSQTNTNVYYIFNGRNYPYANDNAVPLIYDNEDYLVYQAYNDMIYGKRLSSSDVCLMIKRHDWTSNTVYAKYDDQASDLYNTDFYVVNSNNAIFKCLNNANGAPSTVEPSVEDPTDEIYIETVDGYQWKYMYTANSSQVAKFATQEYFPFQENTNVAGNAVSGSIDVILVEATGALKYTATTSNSFNVTAVGGNNLIFELSSDASSTANIYADSAIFVDGINEQRKIVQYDANTKQILIDSVFTTLPNTSVTYTITPNILIVGDGTGAKARAVVNSTTKLISSVLVTSRGSDYTFCNVVVQGYSTVTANTTNTPTLRAIKSPRGGHGKNQAAELGAHWACVSSTINSAQSSSKVVDENDFRIVGILKNPLLRQVSLTIDPAYTVDDYTVGNKITQSNTNANGIITAIDSNNNIITLTSVGGLFNTGNILSSNTSPVVNATCNTVTGQGTYFDQTLRLVCTNSNNDVSGYFTEDETIIQPSRETYYGANGIFYSSNTISNGNTALIRLTHVKGTFNNSDVSTEWLIQGTAGLSGQPEANIQSQILPDLMHGSGEVTYIEDMLPISRNTDQTETFKLIFEF